MAAPPPIFAHQIFLETLRRKAVYHNPPMTADEVQGHIQRLIDTMTRDGHTPDVIRRVLGQSAEVALVEASSHCCNEPRARFFYELIHLELGL